MSNKITQLVESLFYSNKEFQSQNPQNLAEISENPKSFPLSETEFQNFIENLSMMFYTADVIPPFKPIYISPAFEYLGYSIKEWRKEPDFWEKVIHPEDKVSVLDSMDRAVKEGKDFEYQYRIVGSKGEVYWVKDKGRLVRDSAGRVIRIQGVLIDFTEQKETELEIKKREQLYRTMSRHIPLTGIVIFDHDLRFTLAEGELLEKMDLTPRMLEGKTLYEVFPPNISEPLSRFYKSTLAGGFLSIEREFKELDLVIHNYFIPLKNDNKEIYGGMSIWQDITESKRRSERLRESEERYHELFDGANDLVYVHDLEGNYLSMNRAAEKVFGYTREEILKLNMKKIIAPEFLPIAKQKMEEKLKKGSKQTIYEIECLAKDGRRITLEINSSVVYKEGKPFNIQGIARDITERKQMQADLVSSEEQLRNLFENANDLIYLFDLNGKFISTNKAIQLLFGYTEEELHQMHFSQFVAPEYLDFAHQVMQEKLDGIARTIFEIDCLTKTGDRITLEVNSRLMYKNGEMFAIQGIARDITERKIAERKIQDSEAELRALFGSMHDVVIVMDKEGRYLKVPPTNSDLLYSFSAAQIGKTVHEIFDKEKADFFVESINRSLTRNSAERIEYSIEIGKDEWWLSAIISPMTEDLVVIVIRNITERKKNEKLLQESEAEFRALFAAMSDVVLVFNREGRYLKIPPTNPDLLVRPISELIGKTLHDFFPVETADYFLAKINQALDNQEPTVLDYSLEFDGKEKWFSSILSPMSDETVMVVAREITDRKLSEESLRESEEKYRDLFENANDLIYTVNLEGLFTSLNRTCEKVSGYSRKEVFRRKLNISHVVAPESLAVAQKNMADKLAGKKTTPYELNIISKDGNRIPIELNSRVIYQDGKPIGIQGVARDISERKKVEQALKASEMQYRYLSEGIMHHVWTAKPDGRLDYVNSRTLEYFNKKIEDLVNESWMSVVHPEDLSECIEKWTHSLQTGDLYQVEFRLLRHDGVYRWHRALATAGRDSEGNIVKWFGTNTDIHDQKEAEEKLNFFAKHDGLTNLPNRVKFMGHLERVINRSEFRPEIKFAVLFLDLDRFKLINDSLGHLIGDKLLISFAERLETCVRPGDIVARLGGDEFTILLNNLTSQADAIHITDRLIQKLSEPFYLDDYEVFSSASIGIVVSDEIERTAEDFLRDADTAMYRAKEAGKARYEIFNSEMHVRNKTLLQIENDLRHAIDRNEFRVLYQPIVNLETGEICEFEALIRWHHPEHGLVEPLQFIHVAEETGLIIPIGNWIIKEAARQTADWQSRFPQSRPFVVSVNLSSKQLMHPPLAAQIKEVLAETELDVHSLRLEVTESVVMENDEIALNVLNELKQLGVSLSTDDFGTGYSSLSYLHRFPFDSLKIDRAFISKVDIDKKSGEIVRTILMLAQNLNLEAIAEGIETEDQLRQLQLLGCRFGQGYLFSRPVNALEIEQLLIEKSNGFRFDVPPDFQAHIPESAGIH